MPPSTASICNAATSAKSWAIFTVAGKTTFAAQESGGRSQRQEDHHPNDISSWLHINGEGIVTVSLAKSKSAKTGAPLWRNRSPTNSASPRASVRMVMGDTALSLHATWHLRQPFRSVHVPATSPRASARSAPALKAKKQRMRPEENAIIHGMHLVAACLLRVCIFGFLCVLLGSHRAAEQSPSKDIAKQMDHAFSALASADTPGFAVLLKQNGKIVFEKGYGVCDLRSKTAIDAQSNFRLASLSKQFTAMAIMLLVHDGKVRYDQPLTEIFTEFPAYGKPITVRHLLNHTGGLPDYENLMDEVEKTNGRTWSPEKQIQDAEVLRLLEAESHGKFAPGTKWQYSNSGYVVLGLVVAKVSGKSFGEFLRERIFRPLKMDRTLVFAKGKNQITNRAYGYSRKDKAFLETDQSSTSATQGDGGIYSNLQDLGKWDDALRNHTLLGEKESLPAFTPAELPSRGKAELAAGVPESLRGQASAYGFGWFLNLPVAHPLMWHFGDTMGFKTAIFRYTRDNVTVIVLCNRSDLDAGALAIKAERFIISAS